MAKKPIIKKPTDSPEVRRRASWFVLRPEYVTFLRKLCGQTREALADLAELDEETVEQIEAGTDGVTVAELMAVSRAFVVPPGDEEEEYIRRDPKDKMKGGKIGKRDRWGGRRPDEYKDWFHREIKPHLKGDDPNIGKADHDEYERQWRALGCPRPDTIVEF